MRRRALVNAALLAAAAGLALLAWLLPRGDGGPAPLTAVAPADVREVTVRYPREGRQAALELERRADGWHLTAPITRAARDGRVVTVLAVLGARPDSCYDAAEHEPARFGLDPPAVVLEAGDAVVAFGDLAADGRRYVRAGDRLCLLPDRARPLLARGLDGLASPGLLPPGATPVRIETPAARASRATAASSWALERGSGSAETWAARWRGARAEAFLREPPAADLGRLRVSTADGGTHRWRIARRDGGLVLVPEGADYGLVIGAGAAAGLLAPPAAE